MTSPIIRPLRREDLSGVSDIITETGLFPHEMLGDLAQPYLEGRDDALWLVALAGDKIAGVAFAQAEPLADGTWNMLALGVLSHHRRTGVALALVAALERRLAEAAVRILIVDTSGTEDFAGARAFYEAAGYAPEARIRDYWTEGDDKVTFRLRLT